MTAQQARWSRSVLLGLVCATLYTADLPYRAGFFGIVSQAYLAHLQYGFLLAVAMLYRDRLPLRVCMAIELAVWLIAEHHDHPPLTDYLFGVLSSVSGYAILRQATRWMGWPRPAGIRFGVGDVSRFTLYGLIVLPVLLAGANLVLELALTRPTPAWPVLANQQVQVLLGKFFGAMILALPAVVLSTHAPARHRYWRGALSWRLIGLGVLLPTALLQLAGHVPVNVDLLLAILLDNRLLVAALLVWSALHLRLRWSMPLLVGVQVLFAAGLAHDASESVHLPALAGLLRTVIECTMLQLLVLLLMLYNNERDEAAAQHARDSLTEPATGLANLAALRLRCAREALPLGLLLLDRTDKVAASLGLMAQTALVQWVAARLHGVAEVYAIGTGQLALILSRPADPNGWEAALLCLHQSEFDWMAQRVRVLPYLGVAEVEDAVESLEERLQRASQAAVEAMQRGELHPLKADAGCDGGPRASRQRALTLSTVVFSRIRAGEVELYFQPIAALAADAAGAAVSGEVLCRLRDDAGQLLMPGQFLAELQEDRRMAELDLAVFRRLGEWVAEHRPRLPAIGHLSVNIAGQSLASREFARELLRLVDGFPLSAQQLCFEVTETAAITHTQESARLFAQLHERGCQIAIDDFGVGYQSFERLKQIPVDLIKIDGSFVRDMLRSPRDLALVRASVMVARAFGAQTAAEYVADAATAAMLRRLQVDWMQGDFVGCARSIDEVLRDPGRMRM